jgi:formylmethanofuran dehydrogenase subunit E
MIDTKVFVKDTCSVTRIGSYTREEYLERIRAFHGYAAPGVIVGGIMVDMAMERMTPGVPYDAICETASCLPDAVQILTPCTIGNGWMRIINLGRYAVNLYDKYKGDGVRVSLNTQKLHDWDELEAWFLKLTSKKEQNSELVEAQIWQAGRSIYSLEAINIKQSYLTRHSKGAIGICQSCGEAFPKKDGEICLGCQGGSPFQKL